MLRRTARRDRLIGLFVLGVVLFNPPILNLFGGTIFGWPALYVYLFAAWALLIAGIAFVNERGSGSPDDRKVPPR
jgi:O-antigen/teichoic acid export membrane protein